ncbi:MAG: hypothetical protein WCT06_07720, partial [Armatimonadota bacterium]
MTVANGAEGIAASLGRIPPQALEIVGVIILVTAAMYGLYRFFKPDDGAIMWRRMCDSAMQCKASVEPFIRDMISAVSHLAGTVKNVLGKAWEENRGWILMLADAWVRVGMAEWTVIIKAVSIAFTGVAKAVDWLIGKLGKAINLMKYMPQFSMLKAVGDAYWKNSGGLPSGQVGGLSTAGVKTPSKKPGGKNENAAIFARVQEGESGRNHKTSTPRYTSHTGTGGIPTNTYRVPSVTTPSYKTPPPTVDEKADKVIGNLSNARELLDSGAQNLSKWMKGLSVEEHIRRLTQIANGEGQWAKVSIEIRKRAADQIQQLRDRQAQEEEKAIQNHIRLLGEEYAQGKISNEKYIEELKKIAAQKETYQNAGIETARAAAAKIEEIERQNMENRLIIARSLGNEEEVIEIERQQRIEALTRGGMKKEDAETVAKSEADSKLENIFTAKQSQEMEQKDWDKAHGKVSQDEYITFLKTKRNESEQWAKDHGQDSKNNRNYRTVTGKLEDAYNEQARGKIDAAIEENGKNTEALKQALLLLKEEYSALGDAGIKAFDTVNAKIKEFNTGIVESTTTLDTGAVIGTYNVGKRPWGIAVDVDGNVWVSNNAASTVTKLNGSTGAVIGTYNSGSYPTGIAIYADNNIWIANNKLSPDNVTKLDGSTGLIINTCSVGDRSYDIAVDFDGNVWTANYGSDNVTKLNGSTGAVIGSYNVGTYPNCIAVDADNNIWVSIREYFDNVVKLNGSTGAIMGVYSIVDTVQPRGISIDVDGNTWVADFTSNNIVKLNGSAITLAGTYNTGDTPYGVVSGFALQRFTLGYHLPVSSITISPDSITIPVNSSKQFES